MSTLNRNGYVLLSRPDEYYSEMQQVADNWMAWFHRLKADGERAGGNPLEREGRIVSGKNKAVSDGPFAEAKETIGGHFLLTVGSMDETVAIARQCPGSPDGIRAEVRPFAPQCPMVEKLAADEHFAHAGTVS